MCDFHVNCLHFLDWLFEKTVKKLVVVIINIDTHEPLERWQFDIECDKTITENR